MKRKLLSVLLTLCLALSLLPTAALADGEGAQTNDVAQIGSTGYATLAAAIAAAQDGGTVTLLKSCSSERVNLENKSITIDLNGNTLTSTSDYGVMFCAKNGHKITVNGTKEGSKLVGTLMVTSGTDGHIEINGGTYESSRYCPIYINGAVSSENSTLTVKNATITASNSGSNQDMGCGVYLAGYSTSVFENTTITAPVTGIEIRAGKLALENCTVTGGNGTVTTKANGNGTTVQNAALAISQHTTKKPIDVTINGGTFTGNASVYQTNVQNTGSANVKASVKNGNFNGMVSGETNGTIAVSGGTFSSAVPENCCAPGFVPKVNSDGTYGVEINENENRVAEVLDAQGNTVGAYGKLADAITAAKDGDTITLLKDVDNGDGVIVPSGKNFTLDFDTHTYTVTQNLAGSTGTKNQCFQLLKDSTLTFKNGTIMANNGNVAMIIQNYSNLTLENMLLNGASITRNDVIIYTMSNNCGNVEIKDTKINTVPNGVAFDVYGGFGDYSDVTVTVTGSSEINGKIEVARDSGTQNKNTLNINGGTINGELKIDSSIKPGDATAITKTENVSLPAPSGYTWTKVGNTGVLVKEDSAAVVNGVGYATLAAAINAAGNDDTITLLKDAELTSTLNLAKNITIDGQGNYTIKAANNFTVGKDKDNKTCCVLYVSGEVTLKDVTVNGNEKCRVIFCDKGKLTIDGATITNGKAPNYIGGVYMTSSASFEMKSGSITGNKNAEGYQDDKYLQYSSDLWIGANANGALTAINGGTIGNVFVNANKWSASNPGSFTMNGGTVTNLYVEHDANYGATFKYNDGTIEHLYLSKENGNGQSIEVTPVKGVIYNGGVKEQDLVTLTMKYNDGATADSTYNVASGTTITLPTPKRSGYTFNGWYDGSTKVSSPYEVTKNVTLTASWSYNYSGGSSSYDPTYSVSTPSKTENGTVTVSPKNASKGDRVTVTVKPDSGYVLETLTVTDKNGNELTLKDKGNGKYTFTMPAGKVEVKATFMEDNSMLNFFYDVPNNAYFYEAVKWAVKNGITTGVGNNLFAPEQPCTRAQIVTFLWRAAGSPEPKGAASGMTDVVSGSYYEKAVAWAIENGITTGTTTSTFSPDATCTRAQAVTFLARALKAKAASAAEFSDVPTDSYFADAVAWAAANGVTEGIGGGLFGSDNDCTRGQIVTFLYRAYNK